MQETRRQAERARKAFLKLSTTADRTAILNAMAEAIRQNSDAVFEANKNDLAEAKGTIAEPLYKRLILNEAKLRDVVDGIRQIARMEDPVGRILEETELDERVPGPGRQR
jgi:glutamate-5-semialdehyde dehydrogenase